ncbi:hypothetical protein HER15_05205 [Tenacibaculum mesophilum]|uniref:CMP/dCMP-type deaminase domain-containing protein n=1 Tax=Tenacibaculum mesophilum TaxID=104268 RepID=A0AAE9SHU3_9FLAO|nr:hypothetical protein [Tenacibaculum mesophilum]UTD14911.1 hypothetical protein HER15_05205 [Tenacibaculum mesophilum]
MKLDNLYTLRRDFSIIGVTGRTGSGCTKIANHLTQSFDKFNKDGELRPLSDFDPRSHFYRKYNILNNFMASEGNWIPFEKIMYKNVIVLYLFNKESGNLKYLNQLLKKYFVEKLGEENSEIVTKVFKDIVALHKEYVNLIDDIKNLGIIKDITSKDKLLKLNDVFFGADFKQFCHKLFKVLENYGFYRRTLFLHFIACNIRQSGDPLKEKGEGIKHVYTIAEVINRLIKARKLKNNKKPTRIVIDSLRNSLEIMFFKERYSAFYMLATKDVVNNSRDRIIERLKHSIKDENDIEHTADKLLKLDATEYKTSDFSKGLFSSPDVENCIQKSDYHILNLKQGDIKKFFELYPKEKFKEYNFLTRKEQLLKLMGLIAQPGLLTPSSAERCMQIANTAKLNSGCISRNVGAAISDEDFYIKSVGWNDVAKGHTPCNLRDINDIIAPKFEQELKESSHYSPFEKGDFSQNSSFKYKGEYPNNFPIALKDYFKESYDKNKNDLNGKNCAFCFKTVHNHYEGEANQVHTRSLHAEENAMLQITKLGGQGVKNGILFTTASPCELCAKKAYQLGIKTIYFIDPYPGISSDQILNGGTGVPTMIPFAGAIGNAYHKLYDSFMSYKDEISMTLELQQKNKVGIQFKTLLKSLKKDKDIEKLLESTKQFTDEDVIELIKRGLLSSSQDN